MSFSKLELSLETDVLVIGGGMAAAWAATAATLAGARVTLVDKGYVGTSGVTATAGPGHWFVPPEPEKRARALAEREAIAHGLAERRWMERVLGETYDTLPTIEGYYTFARNDEGATVYGALRGPEYMRALRKRIEHLGVRILDHSPVHELLVHRDGSIAGARGYRRQEHEPYTVRAGAVILATGGCAFFSNLLGSRNNTGDGYLMAAELGIPLSGMEFSSQYVVAPAFSTMTRTMSYAYATYYRADGSVLEVPPGERATRTLGRALLDGPVSCDLSRMPEDIRRRLPQISPNVMLPFVRAGIDPFQDRFPVTLIAEGTVRGIGGIEIADDDCQTRVPGLFAAGDAATRELAAGASSGGGAVNSAWALSSGVWSGRAAARRARELGTRSDRPAERVAAVGVRPRREARPRDPMALIAAARAQATDYRINLFREGARIARALDVLDGLWDDARDHLLGVDGDVTRAREAASILATARFSYTAALARRESRGMHVREDAPSADPRLARRQTVSGLDRVGSSFWSEREEAVA